MERIVAIGEAAGGFLSSGGSVMTMRAFMARGWAAGRDCNACEKSCTTGHKLCGVSLWRGTLWRGSQEPRETRLKEAGTERRQSALRSLAYLRVAFGERLALNPRHHHVLDLDILFHAVMRALTAEAAFLHAAERRDFGRN